MNLIAIFIVWDGLEILPFALKNIEPVVDDILIVWSESSNRGNPGNFNRSDYRPYKLLQHEPDIFAQPHKNERSKRNAGLLRAREMGFSHFIMLDCDEFYDQTEFRAEKDRFYDLEPLGMVCGCNLYFGKPDLTIGKDSTIVPFIHKITPNLKFRHNPKYPFAYDENGPRIDPTRQMDINSGVIWSDIIMHHYSWVRKDIDSKVVNSSANLGRSSCREDFANAKEGYFCKMYQKTLVKCENKFNINI